MARKKVLLMGKAHSGKTSMRSIIFANYLARDTMRLSPTLDVEHHHVRFLGDLVLNLWDCGGQDAFYESYFERDRETIFKSVELLIYVFDIASECPEKDFDHFTGVLEAIEENSPDARIFVLVHKMDLVAKEEQLMILEDRRRLIEEICNSCGVHNFQCFGTSIWDETLYKAWSEIVRYLIPNIGVLQTHLDHFCRVCDADEVVLFEKATFLVISHSTAGAAMNESNHLVGTIGAEDLGDSFLTEAKNMEDSDLVGDELDLSTLEQEVTAEIHNDVQGGNDEEALGQRVDDPDSLPLYNIDGETPNETDPNDNYSEVTTDKDVDQEALNDTNNTGNNKVAASSTHFDTHRFEKISNIVKQFKLSCEKAQSQFQGMEVSNSKFSAFINAFTDNTYIMVIVSRKDVHTAATLMNIKNARRHFERFIPRS